jgi:hypothetical protein
MTSGTCSAVPDFCLLASTQEVLLRRKELATQYRYFTFFGFTYTFGSIYNNVVNPRFGNNGGGGMTIMMN